MQFLKKYWNVSFLVSNVLIPLVVLAVYCGTFAYLSDMYLPDVGVNYVFAIRLFKYSMPMLVGVFLVILVQTKFIKKERFSFKNPLEKLSLADSFLLLLPITPVVQYIILNRGILSVIESIYLLAIFLLFSGMLIYVIPVLIGFVSSTWTLMLLGSAFSFTITSMALISQYFSWFEKGSFRIQLIILGGVFLICWFLYHFNNKNFLRLLVVVIFVANTTIILMSQGGKTDSTPIPLSNVENSLYSLVEDRKPVSTPNIYLLVYDAYAPAETMLGYGIDNHSQEDYIKSLGFDIYPKTYSVGASTLESMGRVLNISTEFYGDIRRAVSGDGIVQNILENLGYKTYGIFPSDFFFRGLDSTYDFSIPEKSSPVTLLLNAILIGEFRSDIGFDLQSEQQFLETKQTIFEVISGERAFIYMHSHLPGHSQNSGVCLSDETNQYRLRLESANLEMRQDINTITNADPDAIIIVTSDHGPYLTKNCIATGGTFDISEISRLDIQDRFGTFLAIRWPTNDFANYDDIDVLQDLFPVIFAYLYQDEGILESKIEPKTITPGVISGVEVINGIIFGGFDDGEVLFLSDR